MSDISSKEKPPLCISCGEPLTPEESAQGDTCYICVALTIKEAAIKTKRKIKLPPPENFGRTKEEVEKKFKEKRQKIKIPKLNEATVEVNGISWTPEDRKEMIMNFGFDPGAKPLTRIISSNDPYTCIIFEIPEKIEKPYEIFIQDMLDKTLDAIIKILTFGPHHSDMESILRGSGGPLDKLPSGGM